jgi:hypothetical protein
MIEAYAIGGIFTAGYLLGTTPPRGAGDLLGLSACALFWPAFLAWVLYTAIRDRVR